MLGARIGCGFFARNHLDGWRDMRGDCVELAAVCDVGPAQGRRPRRFRCPTQPVVRVCERIKL